MITIVAKLIVIHKNLVPLEREKFKFNLGITTKMKQIPKKIEVEAIKKILIGKGFE